MAVKAGAGHPLSRGLAAATQIRLSFASQSSGAIMSAMNSSFPSIIEEVLSLSTRERAGLARLLVKSLEGDPRTDDEIRADLHSRLEALMSGEDTGLSFEQVFGKPA